MAESFFSRLRRAQIATHHHIGGYLSAYADEMPWRENNRRISNDEQFHEVANAALVHGKSTSRRGTGSAGQRIDVSLLTLRNTNFGLTIGQITILVRQSRGC